MNTCGTPDNTARAVQIDSAHLDAILDRLDGEAGTPVRERRRSKRHTYRAKAVVIRTEQPDMASPVAHRVPARNICQAGLALLHTISVHPDTPCLARLITADGTWNDVLGTVVHCRHVEANIYEWGLSFQYGLDPSVYCSAAKHWRALLVEDDPSCARLARFLLRQLNIEDVEHVPDGRAAVDKATRSTYDLILMDMEMPVLDGFSATRELRLSGYRGPIIAMTGLTQAADRQRCLDAGCDRYLSKPVSRSDLSLVIESLSTEPLLSRLADDAAMTDIIDAFVGELPSKIQAIEEAAARRDGKRLEFLARGLKAVGSGYGFEAITDAAAKIEAALIDGASPGDVQGDVCALSSLCRRVRSRPGPEHPCDNKAETGSGTEDARPRDPRATNSSHPDA